MTLENQIVEYWEVSWHVRRNNVDSMIMSEICSMRRVVENEVLQRRVEELYKRAEAVRCNGP